MTLRTLNYGNYGIFLIMGNAGFCPSTVLGGSRVVIRVPLRVPLKGSIGILYIGFRAWRFVGSYKWGYKSPNMSYKYSSPTYNPHEPSSTDQSSFNPKPRAVPKSNSTKPLDFPKRYPLGTHFKTRQATSSRPTTLPRTPKAQNPKP